MITQTCHKYIQNRNAFCLSCLNGLFIGRETYLPHNPAHATNFTLIYTKSLMSISNRLIFELEQNGILFKLFLAVFSFSRNLSVLSHEKNYQEIHSDDYFKLNQYENIFIDLLWKYMLFEYDYHECIYRFSAMIKILLDLLDQLYQTEQMSKTKQLL